MEFCAFPNFRFYLPKKSGYGSPSVLLVPGDTSEEACLRAARLLLGATGGPVLYSKQACYGTFMALDFVEQYMCVEDGDSVMLFEEPMKEHVSVLKKYDGSTDTLSVYCENIGGLFISPSCYHAPMTTTLSWEDSLTHCNISNRQGRIAWVGFTQKYP